MTNTVKNKRFGIMVGTQKDLDARNWAPFKVVSFKATVEGARNEIARKNAQFTNQVLGLVYIAFDSVEKNLLVG